VSLILLKTGAQLKALNIEPSLSFITYDTTRYVKELIPITRPFGQIGSIVETDDGVPVHQGGAMGRSLSYHWEFMFTKPIFGHELESQGRILEQVAKLAAEGTIPSQVTVRKEFSLASLREGHELQGSGKAYGKIAFTVPETWS
jgi:NADPH:quinone reductase